MARHNRFRVYALASIYVAIAAAWMAFAVWVVPPLLAAKDPGKTVSAVNWYIWSFASAFLPHDIVGRWRQFTLAVLIAIVLHLTIVVILRRLDGRSESGRAPAELRAERYANLWLSFVSLVFLAVTLISGPIHDYHYYLNMWYEVEQGHDPWFLVAGGNGTTPLNAYGPLFNLLAVLDWLNPLAPKLFFAYAYIVFVLLAIKGFTASHGASLLSLVGLTALFWNPFPWVEIAIRGHFDILVALLCIGAIRAWIGSRDLLSGTSLALGVLLKYFPITLLPFLALDRGRIRWKFVVVAVTLIALGLGSSYLNWGPSLFRPLTFGATRSSNFMSIFYFLRGQYSPLRGMMVMPNFDPLAPVVLFVALLRAWSWYRTRHADIEAACVVAVTTTALFYHTGFPQYHMVPFVLGADWVARHWGILRDRPGRVIAIASYPAWLAVLDCYYLFVDGGNAGPRYWNVLREVAGLVTFLFGCACLAGVVLSAGRSGDGAVDQPESRVLGTTAAPGGLSV
jgi:Glycosyltransferase family 87